MSAKKLDSLVTSPVLTCVGDGPGSVAPDSGTTSARRGVVWVYVVVAHPGEVLPVCGKVLRGAVT